MSFCPAVPDQKNYNITDRGWFKDTLRPVSKNEFLQHQHSHSNFSTNKIIKTLAAGILGASQAFRTTPLARVGTQIATPILASFLWSQIPTALAQTTTTKVTPVPTPAPGPQGDEFQVNTYTTNNQLSPTVAALAGGGFAVVWVSGSQDGSASGIYGQRYDASGAKVGSEFQINTYTTNNQDSPFVATLAGRGFVVIWQSDGQDGDSGGIFGQKYDASGAKVGGEFQINTYTKNYQSLPTVAALAEGGFVVTWQSSFQDASGWGIFGQRYDASGAKAGIEFQINTYTTNNQQSPTVAALSGGGFVVAWQGDDQDGDSLGIFGQRYDASGDKVGGEFQINTYTTSNQRSPSLAALYAGGFVVTWQSDGQDGSGGGIYGQRYDALGAKVGIEFQINTYTIGTQFIPNVAALSGGGFVVTWTSGSQDGSGSGVYGQKYDASGDKVGGEFQINNYTISDQANTKVAALSGDGFVVTWQSNGQDGSVYGVFGRIFPGNSTSATNPTTTSSLSPTTQTMDTLITQGAKTNSTITKTTSIGTTVKTPSSTAERTMHSLSTLNPITERSNSSSGSNIPLIAGLAGGVGALVCGFVAAVVFILRQHSKNKATASNQGIDLSSLASNQPPLSSDPVNSSANKYAQNSIKYGQVNQNEYTSARFETRESHYSNPNERIRELERNSSQANYGDTHELESLNKAVPNTNDPGYEPKGYITTPYTSQHEGPAKYSDPLTRLEELKRNPPQANYVGDYQLQQMNAEVLS